ncbi:PREDICTED: uncharacterized protein LOC105363638 [Ceratosolen solmsi marchali]|uniref:Uncharacterized protein LOC105363638 n=1 Tax=Ceratosolen solmsi marchali TaxID=326594 RepID=A0AAJ6YKF9_9HYME|nr:PREDICTED: uncharacterized protein LOC105363638 [Ceratosolen solmsi marchali]
MTRSLKDDLHDFQRLVPKEQLVTLFYEYLSEDEDFGDALDYVTSNDFKALLRDVEGMSEISHLLRFLQESGLNAYGFVNKINDVLGIDKISPPSRFMLNRISGGLPGFIKDVKALLPVHELEELYREKLTSSENFAELIKRLRSAEFQGFVDKLMGHKEMQHLLKRAEAKGVDVQAIFDFLSSVLGLKFPPRTVEFMTRSLKDDLHDFQRLVPKEQLVTLFYEYLSEDEDFGDALDYVTSNDFKALLRDVEGMSEISHLLRFLQESGLNAYGFVNKINDVLGIDKISPPSRFMLNRISGGLPGFIKDVKALLPVHELEELYREKLTSSENFAELIKRLRSAEFQGFVDKLMGHKEMQHLLKRAEAKGVDVQAIFDFLSSVLGLKFPSQLIFKDEEVIDILYQIWSKVSLDNIIDVVVTYFFEDQDFGKVVKYMLNDEFKNILSDIEDLPEIRSVFIYLDKYSINIYSWINEFNGILGLNKTLPSRNTYMKVTGGIPGFIQDIKSQIPVDELQNLFDEKLRTSSKFKTFIDRLNKHELQDAVNVLNKHKGFNLLLRKLEALGVDWNEVIKIINALTGIKFPDRPSNRHFVSIYFLNFA